MIDCDFCDAEMELVWSGHCGERYRCPKCDHEVDVPVMQELPGKSPLRITQENLDIARRAVEHAERMSNFGTFEENLTGFDKNFLDDLKVGWKD